MKITDEMIEAGAKVTRRFANSVKESDPEGFWSDCYESERQQWRNVAEVVLEAALAVAPEQVDPVVTEEMIAEELSNHHFIHGLSRRNSCHCGVEVGEFEQYRNHEAQAILALFRGGAK